MSKLGYFVSFALGAAIGAGVTYKMMKDGFEKDLQEQVQSIRDIYRKSEERFDEWREEKTEAVKEEIEKIKSAVEKNMNKKPLVDYAGYFGSAAGEAIERLEKEEIPGGPFVISPDVFGEIDDYDIIDLKYFEDGVLVDEMDEPIEDIAGTIGEDFEDHFGEYEEDSVFIQNDQRKCYYEVLRDLRSYEIDVKPLKARPVEIREDEEYGEDTED